jgi:ABC-2 type transport system permease protein
MTAGLGELLRLALRRDRIMLPVWVYALIGSVLSTLVSLRRLYPDDASRDRLAQSINGNPSLRALYGPVHDAHGLGALTAWRILPFGGLMIGLLCVLLITRHTRAEEESGRLELVGAGAVGRAVPLAAALGTVLTACVAVALAVPLLMIAFGQDVAGSFALGLAYAGVGLVFAGAAALAAQVTGTARAANGIGGALLGLAYLLRACGDASGGSGPEWLVWLSPLGWAERVRPYGGNAWWLIALMLAVFLVQVAGAYVLAGRRDLGSGLLPQRPGPPAGAPSLRSAYALGLRLQRGSLYGWTAAFLASGLVFGGISRGIRQLLEGSGSMQQLLERMGGTKGAVDSYLSTMISTFALVAAVYAVQTVLRLRAEEIGGRAEPVLATGVARLTWAWSHLVYPLLGSAVLLLVAGLGLGVGAGAVLGDTGGWTWRLLGAALVQLPAVWVFAGVAVALFGLLPRWTAAAWGVLGALLFVAYLGPLLSAGQWLLDLTPFTHVPRLPGGTVTLQPLLWLTAVTVVLGGAGLAGLRRRDLG